MNYVERLVAKQIKQYHKETYVDYRKEAIVAKLKKKELETLLEWLKANAYTVIKHTTLRAKIPEKSYSICYNDHIIKLTVYDGEHYYWYTTNYSDDTKNLDTPNSFKKFKAMFKKRTGTTFLKAFGRTSQFYKKFCPKPLYYINTKYPMCKWLDHICKEDFSSHYPWASVQLLPDATTSKTVDEYVKPTEEYPFAFYPDTGHVAIFGELDSHDWIKEVVTYSAKVKVKTYYPPDYEAKDKRTVLMKGSNFLIDAEVKHFYDIKCNSKKDSIEYNNAKIFLLKFIGMLEQINPRIYASYPFAHLAAVIKWRANVKMFRTLKEIGYNNIIQVCVDGIIHAGPALGNYTVALGELNIECLEGKFIQRGLNQYILKSDNFKEVKHVGLDVNTNSNNIMTWLASKKINFIEYLKHHYEMEDLTYEKKGKTNL